jgi:hypothetical protein
VRIGKGEGQRGRHVRGVFRHSCVVWLCGVIGIACGVLGIVCVGFAVSRRVLSFCDGRKGEVRIRVGGGV